VCKCIQHPLLLSTKGHCLVASVVTPRGPENKRLHLRTPTSSLITSCRLPVVLLAPKERERRRGKKVKDYLGHTIDFLELVHPGSDDLGHQVWPLRGWGQLELTFLCLHST
jgi:hypothetical protein